MFAKNWMFVVSLGVLALALTAVPAGATVIIYDTFTASNGTKIEGRAPDTVNLPSGTWARNNLHWSSSIQGNAFYAGPDTGWTVPIASSGGYTRPDALTISADLMVLNLTDGGGGGGGFALGFNTTSGDSYSTFTGLVLHQNGRLTYRQEGSDIASVAWSGPAFDKTAYYHLSYEVNTSSGALSNIVLQNSTADYSTLVSAGDFTAARTAYAAMYANGGGGGDKGYIDNFLLMPEPATMALLGLGGLGVLLRRKRR